MRNTIFASLASISALTLTLNCGGGGGGGGSGNDGSGGTGGAGGTTGTTKSGGSGGSAGGSGGATNTSNTNASTTSTSASGGSDSSGGNGAGGSSGGAGGNGGAGGSGGTADTGGTGGSGEGGEAGDPGTGGTDSSGGTGGTPSTGGTGGGGTGGGGTGGGGAGGTGGGHTVVACPATAEDLAEAYAQMICQKREECCLDEYNGCMASIVGSIEALFPGAQAAQDGGTASLDCDAFDACAIAVHDSDCGEWPMQNGDYFGLAVDEPACREVMEPLVAPEGACTSHYQCIDGFCYESACMALVGDGDECSATAPCNTSTHFCHPDTSTCTARLEDGATCTSGTQCESRVCDGTAEVPGVCVATAGEDNECSYVPAPPPTTCSMTKASSGAQGGMGFVLLGMLGVGLGLGRRRRSAS